MTAPDTYFDQFLKVVTFSSHCVAYNSIFQIITIAIDDFVSFFARLVNPYACTTELLEMKNGSFRDFFSIYGSIKILPV
ncbi:MAG: hypothetical protein K1X81_02575 [Bacteroidia bacterium]|nr:hypothetical protein [Bacteroidia bacterium]